MNEPNNEKKELTVDEIVALYSNASEAGTDSAAGNNTVEGTNAAYVNNPIDGANAVPEQVSAEVAENTSDLVDTDNTSNANNSVNSGNAYYSPNTDNAIDTNNYNNVGYTDNYNNVSYTDNSNNVVNTVNSDIAMNTGIDSSDVYHIEEPVAVKTKKKKGKKILKISLCTFFGLLLTGYFVMVYLMTRYLYPNTIINGGDFSFETVAAADEYLDSLYADYNLDILLRNGKANVKASDIDYKVCFLKELDEIKSKQNPFLWFTCYERREYTIDYEVSYSDEKLKGAIDNLGFLKEENMTADENPTFEVEGSIVNIIEGAKGTVLDNNMTLSAIKSALNDTLYAVNLEEKDCYMEGVFTAESKNVVDAKNKIDVYLMTEVNYQYGDYLINVPKEEIYKMINVSSNFNVTINRAKVKEYVVDFAASHDTYGTERKFRTHDGKLINVLGKSYGWQIDIETEVENLYQDIIAGRTVTREPAFTNKAYTYNGTDDIGDTYCEVDLANQKVYCYIKGSLALESDCVSGNASAGHNTPGGLYCIKNKMLNAVLRGQDYASPVGYWMPFNGGIGFHDANWRRSFGGEIYKRNGSHGCVNMPIPKARDLYKLVVKGMPVVCYW